MLEKERTSRNSDDTRHNATEGRTRWSRNQSLVCGLWFNQRYGGDNSDGGKQMKNMAKHTCVIDSVEPCIHEEHLTGGRVIFLGLLAPAAPR